MYSRANIALSGNWSKFLVDSMWIWFGFWHILKKSTMKTEKFTIYNSIFHKLMIRFSYVQLKGCRKLQKTYQHFLFWDVTADISEAVNRHHNLTMWIQFIETTKCDKVVGGIVSEKTPFQKEIIFFSWRFMSRASHTFGYFPLLLCIIPYVWSCEIISTSRWLRFNFDSTFYSSHLFLDYYLELLYIAFVMHIAMISFWFVQFRFFHNDSFRFRKCEYKLCR